MKTEDLATLEGLVDTYSLPRVLEALAEVCNDKASHLRSAWQDENAAKRWDGSSICWHASTRCRRAPI